MVRRVDLVVGVGAPVVGRCPTGRNRRSDVDLFVLVGV